jgi:CheY-like chemotaxis protein
MTFARKHPIAPRVVNLGDVLPGMLGMLERLIGERIQLAWESGLGLWPVRIDPSQIDQILTNLCINARDATSGSGKIAVATGNASFDAEFCKGHPGHLLGDFVCLSVRDNGCGMSAETLSHMFEPFFTTKGASGGTGLGLASVYGAVRQNEGFVTVESTLGAGSTFSVYIPRYLAGTETASPSGPFPDSSPGRKTVLLVEDNPAILKGVAWSMKQLGYTVNSVGTPAEAIRFATLHHGIDLLLTDVMMPQMNGWDLSEELLKLQPGLKVLFMSGYSDDIIAQHGVLGEGVHFIQKPFTMADLAVKVAGLLAPPGN